HALPLLALGACGPPCRFGRPGPARLGLRVDFDGAGIPGGLFLEAFRLPPGAQSVCTLRVRAVVLVPGPAPVLLGPGQQAGSSVGVLDEPGDSGPVRRPELLDGPQSVPRDSALCDDCNR